MPLPRSRAVARDDVKILAMLSVIVDETEEKAKAKYEDYKKYINLDSAQAIIGGWSGVDLSQFDEDEVLNYVQTESIQSFLTPFTLQAKDKKWTRKAIAEHTTLGGMGDVIVGDPVQVADELERWIDEGAWTASTWRTTSPRVPSRTSSSTLFPSCRSAAGYRTEYEGNTLRENIFGKGHTKVADSHPAAKYRGAYVGKPRRLTPRSRDCRISVAAEACRVGSLKLND